MKELNIMNFIGENKEREMLFFRGYLYIEKLMATFIMKKYKKDILDSEDTYYKKVIFLYKNNHLSKEWKKFLLDINKLRNEIAHNLFYNIKWNSIHDLIGKSYSLNVYYSDDDIYSGDIKYFIDNYYSNNLGITEFFSNTFCELASYLEFNEEEINGMIM